MRSRNRWIIPTVIALLSVLLPAALLSSAYLTAPDSPLFHPLISPELFSPPGVTLMPDFPNDPISPLFVLSVGAGVLVAGVLGIVGILILRWRERGAKLSSLVAVIVGPVLWWVAVFVVPMAHRVIRDYNAGFTRTDLLSYTAILWTWVLAAVVCQIVVWAVDRSHRTASPT